MSKLILIAGNKSHGSGAHEHPAGCYLLSDLLNKHVKGINVEAYQGWPQDKKVFDGADAFAIYSDGGDGHLVIPHLDEVAELAQKGMGIGMLHYAVEVPKGKPGNCFLDWIGGYFEMHWSVNPHWTADFSSFPKHPITSGLVPFSLEDEWYYHMRFRPNMEGITTLLSTVPPASTMDRPDGPHSGNPDVRKAVANKEPQHLAWCVERPDGGRGFGFTGGHYHKGWADDNLRKFILNALAWLAKVDVPKDGIDTPKPTQKELDEYLLK